ncbi:glycosyltransferase, partial [Candidatus Pelagibacter sp.]|nr:glycosyltransferase [Candidatus Pelagibacter sp.]
MNISVVIVAFKSDHVLESLISKIPNHHEIIVVENSLQKGTKKNLESKFQNTKVFIPNENLGYSGGVNLGVEKSNHNFILIVTPDVSFSTEMLKNLEDCIEKFNDFTLLAPVYENSSVHKNFKIFHKNK